MKTTIAVPRATRPRPRDPERVISELLTYLGTEEACGAAHVRITEVRQLLRRSP